MKTMCTRVLVVVAGVLIMHASAFSQQVAKSIPYAASPEGLIGFLEFKPTDYGTQKHPLIIFMHGIGERGNGTTQVSSVAANGIPRLCAAGATMRFTVAGQTSSFVVLSPQLSVYYGAWPAFYVKEMIKYAKANLQIDTNRIYVTGLSLGGGGTWVYAFDSLKNDLAIAALAPVCGTDDGNDGNACASAGTAKLPIWGFHCKDDGTVSYNNTVHVQLVFQYGCSSMTPTPRFTYYLSGGHSGAWNNAYDTGHITRLVDSSLVGGTSTSVNFTPTLNLYEWFLSNKRATPVAVVNGPTSVAATSTTLDASASYSPYGAITNYSWTQTSGPTSATIGSSTAVPVISNLSTGSYTFQVAVTDVLGATASTTKTLSVTAAALPVTYAYFRGQRNGKVNQLLWETSSEQNSDYFSIERSTDGNSYTTIGKVVAAGNSALPIDYSFTDNSSPAGNAFYRLRQVDKDGNYKLSDVVVISGADQKTIEQLYPNPVREQLNVVLNNNAKGGGRISVYDLTGRALYQQAIDKSQEVFSTSVNMKNLVPGLYVVEVKVGEGYKVMQRVLKQ